jgi:hypothetical protein
VPISTRIFLLDVACKLRVWENHSGPQVPPHLGRNGHPRNRAHPIPATAEAVQVEVSHTARHFAAEAKELTIREAARGMLQAKVWVRSTWV